MSKTYTNRSYLLLAKLVIGNTKGFIRGKALSVEGHTHSVNDLSGVVNMEIVSYYGTGTYGISNPTSITFSKPMQIAIMLQAVYNYNSTPQIEHFPNCNGIYGTTKTSPLWIVYMKNGPTEYTDNFGFRQDNASNSKTTMGKVSLDRRTLTWYFSLNNEYGPQYQCNQRNCMYHVLGIGF